jgi:ATP-dependent DNA ligase
MENKITLKKKEGYTSTKPSDEDTIVQADVDLDNLPTNLCPNKPISQNSLPEKILNGRDAYGQRKHNGHCLIFVKGKKTEKVYSRRMEDLTSYIGHLSLIQETMSKVPKGSMVLTEMVWTDNALKKEVPRIVATIVRSQDPKDVSGKFKAFSKLGQFKIIPFDALFLEHKFVGDQDYTSRYGRLNALGLFCPILLMDWKDEIESAKKANWEGFVLRLPGKNSHVSYTMDGKAHRAGSWKYKFTKEGDFIIDEVLYGKSGKHAKFYSKFHVYQLQPVEDGRVAIPIDRGYVGPGTLTHEELEQLTKDINSKKRKLPFVVEVEYQSIHDETGKLEFGQIQRIREDKTPEECIADE